MPMSLRPQDIDPEAIGWSVTNDERIARIRDASFSQSWLPRWLHTFIWDWKQKKRWVRLFKQADDVEAWIKKNSKN